MKKIFFLIYCCITLLLFTVAAQQTYPSQVIMASESYLDIYAKGFDPAHITVPEKASFELINNPKIY
ncbi:MAG: hypothetical protein J0I84_03400 [Terrimonas sp.]|nr:hypothetical protein [Terrimonas sp.]OJY88265.1 MAG: hypothetical protein BGP13_06960 [Sphingobacteriales bacterium 40-81]